MTSSSTRILVIEDDNSIRLGLVDTLTAKGYAVTATGGAKQGLEAARASRPDLIILDVMLPDGDGFDVCRQIKAARSEIASIPIIMLTARGAELDRVRGLELGADDYVTKPFSLMELLARIAAVLRRGRPAADADPQALQFGDVWIDFAKQKATKGGVALELPTRAYAILRAFARRPGEVVTREQLLDEAWGYDKYPNTRTVDNHVVKLRRLLEDVPERPRHLLTVHGAGYRLEVDAGDD